MALSAHEQTDRSPADTEAPVALRQCPALSGDLRSLITHRIGTPLCLKRQREHYHKCHRCLYRGEPADLVIPDQPRLGPVAESGLPSEIVDLPAGRNGASRNGSL